MFGYICARETSKKKRRDGMLVTEIECRATAPLFIAGADTRNPEMRAASIKGVMRYIWRAVQCASNVKSLRDAESRLFGSTDENRTTISQLKLQVVEEEKVVGKENMVPHRALYDEYNGNGRPFSSEAIKENSTVIVRIITNSGVSKEQHYKYVCLFVLTTILIGFGRRSRKGMGTVAVESIAGDAGNVNFKVEKLQDLLPLLKVISEMGAVYYVDDCGVWSKPEGEPFNYPHIEKIYIWKPLSDNIRPIHITEQIGLSTHEFHNAVFTGNTKSESRFASSILMSTTGYENSAAVITCLKCIRDYDEVERNNFLDDLYRRIVR